MAKKDSSKHTIEGVISETYPYKDDDQVRLAIDGDSTRIETFVPAEFGSNLKMGDKVKLTIEAIGKSASSMIAGTFNEWLTLQHKAQTDDGQGGVTFAYSTYATERGRVSHLGRASSKSSEVHFGQQLQEWVSDIIYLRPGLYGTLTRGDRIVDSSGITYEVLAVRHPSAMPRATLKSNVARCKPVPSQILTWNAGAIIDRTNEQVEKGMTTAVIYLEGEAKELVSVPGDGHGGDPSAPGEPPHRQHGNLRADISHEVVVEDDKVIGAIGITAGSIASNYARRLELGFVGADSLGRNYNEAARPFLRPTILRNREKIVELIKGA